MNAYQVTTSWNHEGPFAEVTEYVLANSIEEAREQYMTTLPGGPSLDFNLDITVSTAVDFNPYEFLEDIEEHVKECNIYRDTIARNLDDLYTYVSDLKQVDPQIKLNMLEHVVYLRNLLPNSFG